MTDFYLLQAKETLLRMLTITGNVIQRQLTQSWQV